MHTNGTIHKYIQILNGLEVDILCRIWQIVLVWPCQDGIEWLHHTLVGHCFQMLAAVGLVEKYTANRLDDMKWDTLSSEHHGINIATSNKKNILECHDMASSWYHWLYRYHCMYYLQLSNITKYNIVRYSILLFRIEYDKVSMSTHIHTSTWLSWHDWFRTVKLSFPTRLTVKLFICCSIVCYHTMGRYRSLDQCIHCKR